MKSYGNPAKIIASLRSAPLRSALESQLRSALEKLRSGGALSGLAGRSLTPWNPQESAGFPGMS